MQGSPSCSFRLHRKRRTTSLRVLVAILTILMAYACTGDDVTTNTTETAAASGGASSVSPSAATGFSTGMGGGCNELTVNFERQVPTVMLLVDRSSSMFDNAYGMSPDRWQPLRDALMHATDGVVTQLDDSVRFGFAAYTNNASSNTCPLMNEVSPKLDNYATIKTAYDQASSKPSFKGETPTGPAITKAASTLAAISDPGSKYIILATDGEPDTCAHPDPQCGQDESIHALQQAYAAGVTTFVIGIGNEVGNKHLGDLANAGVGKPVSQPEQNWIYTCLNTGISGKNATYASNGGDAAFYKPTDQAQLAKDLQGIVSGVQDCVFELKARVDLDDGYLCKVTLDGKPLTHIQDWQLKSETELELVGSTCDLLKSEAKQLHIDCPCDVVAPL